MDIQWNLKPKWLIIKDKIPIDGTSYSLLPKVSNFGWLTQRDFEMNEKEDQDIRMKNKIIMLKIWMVDIVIRNITSICSLVSFLFFISFSIQINMKCGVKIAMPKLKNIGVGKNSLTLQQVRNFPCYLHPFLVAHYEWKDLVL